MVHLSLTPTHRNTPEDTKHYYYYELFSSKHLITVYN